MFAFLCLLFLDLLWYLRPRPEFPEGLCYHADHLESGARERPQPVRGGSLFRTLFGLIPQQRIDILGVGRAIAVLRPVKHGDLYELVAGRGFRIAALAPGVSPVGAERAVRIRVRVPYRLDSEEGDKSYFFMLDYQR